MEPGKRLVNIAFARWNHCSFWIDFFYKTLLSWHLAANWMDIEEYQKTTCCLTRIHMDNKVWILYIRFSKFQQVPLYFWMLPLAAEVRHNFSISKILFLRLKPIIYYCIEFIWLTTTHRLNYYNKAKCLYKYINKYVKNITLHQ